jgi:hypothetical protein
MNIDNARISDAEVDSMVISDELYKKETLKLLMQIRNVLIASYDRLGEMHYDIVNES